MNKEVNNVKKTDMPDIIIVNGDNNKVSFVEKTSLPRAIVILAISIVIAVAILAISLCCPELLADIVRWIINICKAINS